MYWMLFVVAAVLAGGVRITQGSRANEAQRKKDLEEFEKRKVEQQEDFCPCRPGGCCPGVTDPPDPNP